jgi:maltose O-acetyltransferase
MIFKKCGKKVNVGKGARFNRGFNIEIDDFSGIGVNCHVPENIKIGKYVMMGQNVIVFGAKHNFESVDIPMIKQGVTISKPVIIEDDVWIGSNVIIMPGRVVRKGTIIGAGSVLTKDFPEYSIVAGNPAKLIRSRIV